MSTYVAVVKDPFGRLSEASVFSGTLAQVVEQLVECEYVTREAVRDLEFHEGSCVFPSDSGLDVVIFAP